MRKPVSRWLLVFFTISLTHAGYSQVDSMMNVYADRLALEKIHIHFDKSIYNRGETVWYKVYILQSRDTAASSRNVYLEWYDADGKLITHTVSPVHLSTAQGSFDIPGDYRSGTLQVKAFTRWMLNDDPAFSYSRELAININAPVSAVREPYRTTVETFPEGGFLIQGVHSRVAFKATNQYGHPVFIKGVLIDDKNNILDSLNVKHDGMGSFYMLPLPGQSYTLNWTDEYGTTGTTAIPVTKTEGAHITVVQSNGKARFQVERTESVPEAFRKMVLVVHMNRVGLYQIAINVSEKTKINAEIPIHDLPTGLLQFTLFTSDWIPVAERVMFVNNNMHGFDVKVTAPLVNTGKKGKNAIEIFVPDSLFTNMSMSVTDAAVNLPAQHSIFSDVLLSSEVKGKIYNPAYYFSSNADSVLAHLDLVMLTNAWRRFDWEKIRANMPPVINYSVETGIMKIQGKVLGMKADMADPVLNIIVYGKDSTKQLISVPVAPDGSFEHPMVFYDTAKLYYSFNNNPSLTEKAKLQFSNGLLNLSSHKSISPANGNFYLSNESLAKQRLDALLAEQDMLRKKMAETTLKEVTVTTKAKTKEESLSDKYSTGFFKAGPTRKEYIWDMTDNTKTVFGKDVFEYLTGKVPGLNIVLMDVPPYYYRIGWRGDEPGYFIDEMPVQQQQLLDVPIAGIAMIKVFPPPFMFAAGGGRGGAIVVYRKKGGDDKIMDNTKGVPNAVLTGYSKFKEFYNPSYEQQDEEYMKPDSRTTLYWDPYLITNDKLQRRRIEFFNNDFTKTFSVILEGINIAGKMTRVVKTISADTKNN